MKKLLLAVALLGGLSQNLFADQVFKGTLKGMDSCDKHTTDLSDGKYRYNLSLTGHKGAKVNLHITKKRASGLTQQLVSMENLATGNTYNGTFDVTVKNPLGQDVSGTREVNIKLCKKVGPRRASYVLTISKIQ